MKKISVIIPVYNAEDNICQLIESLLNQDYPKDNYEVIVVDNNSEDSTPDLIKQYPVTLLVEKDVQSSYAARNTGIRQANHEVYAFIDSDCIADKEWLKQGIEMMEQENAEMVGGRVNFVYSPKQSAAELYDAITNMQNDIGIKNRGVSTTSNLLVKADVFNMVGLFPDDVKSGGDVQWTGMATSRGHKLVYCAKAVVNHPARNLSELLKKSLRVGKGYWNVWQTQNVPMKKRIWLIARHFLPINIQTIKRRINERGDQGMVNRLWGIWFIAYLCEIYVGFGIVASRLGFR